MVSVIESIHIVLILELPATLHHDISHALTYLQFLLYFIGKHAADVHAGRLLSFFLHLPHYLPLMLSFDMQAAAVTMND